MGGLYPAPIYRLAGDRGLLIEFGDIIAPEVNQQVRAMFIALNDKALAGVKELIPTYSSLLIFYDPLVTNPKKLRLILDVLVQALSQIVIPQPETTEIPVCYGGAMGPDMDFVSSHTGLSDDEIVRMHSEALYQIFMIGFTPGFPFLGGLPKSLYTPRLQTPRNLVPAGSVGIANNQTGIYPIDSPGGWQLIGRTPLKIFDPARSRPFALKTGDFVKFKPITLDEYWRLTALTAGNAHDKDFRSA